MLCVLFLLFTETNGNDNQKNNSVEGNYSAPSDVTLKSEEIEGNKSTDVFGRDLELPRFSSGVQRALTQNRSAEVWSEVIDEMLCFYSRHFEGKI